MVHEKNIKIFITQVLEEKQKMDVKIAAENFCITVLSDVAFFFPFSFHSRRLQVNFGFQFYKKDLEKKTFIYVAIFFLFFTVLTAERL